MLRQHVPAVPFVLRGFAGLRPVVPAFLIAFFFPLPFAAMF